MKYIIIVALAIIYISCGAQTVQQEKSAHQAIKAFIAEKYPDAKSKMILEDYRSYRADFKSDGHRYTAKFSFKGNWVQTEKKIKPAELADNVRRSFDTTKYKGGKIYSVIEITSVKKPGITYMVEVRYDRHDPEFDTYDTIVTELHKLYFTNTGELATDELEPDQSLPYIPWGND
jgi:hypothetical protein